MSTTIRPNVSKKNEYWIDRNRYYELKHFCLQYDSWISALRSIDGYQNFDQFSERIRSDRIHSVTETAVLNRDYYENRIRIVKRAANCTDEHLGYYILLAVTNSYNYDYLRLVLEIPCSRGVYYKLYRKFFWILDKLRE